MDTLFPLGLPWPSAFYLTMYLLTFVLHQAFMHYVLAGSLYVAWVTIRPGRDPVTLPQQLLAATLRDWMPFLLSAAITAGVAPLLFIQIVYQHHFYTANLLLWWRWMVLVPVLIIAFYLLYLIKSRMLWNWPYFVRVAVACGTSLCFVFAGFCWTVNHLLANDSPSWPDVYVTGRLPFHATTVILRMLIWLGGSFASMSIIAGWQLLNRSRHDEQQNRTVSQTLAILSTIGLGVAFVAGFAYVIRCDDRARTFVFGSAILPYILVTIVGVSLQVVGWIQQWRSRKLESFWLALATVGAVLSLAAVSVIREGLRMSSIDLASLSQTHSSAATVGGFSVFLTAAVVVVLLIVWCIRLVQSGLNEGHSPV